MEARSGAPRQLLMESSRSMGELTLVLIILALTVQTLDLGSDAVEQLVQARARVGSRRSASHAAVRIHGHLCDAGMEILGIGRWYGWCRAAAATRLLVRTGM